MVISASCAAEAFWRKLLLTGRGGFDGFLLPRRRCRPAKLGRWLAWSGLESQLEVAAVIQNAKLTDGGHSVTRADPHTRVH